MSVQKIKAAKAEVTLKMEKGTFDKDVVESQRQMDKFGKRAKGINRDLSAAARATGDALRAVGGGQFVGVIEGAADGFETIRLAAEQVSDIQGSLITKSAAWKSNMWEIAKVGKSIAAIHPGIKAGIIGITVAVGVLHAAMDKWNDQLERQKKLESDLALAESKRFKNYITNLEKAMRLQRERAAAEALIGKRADLTAARTELAKEQAKIDAGQNLGNVGDILDAKIAVATLQARIAKLEGLQGTVNGSKTATLTPFQEMFLDFLPEAEKARNRREERDEAKQKILNKRWAGFSKVTGIISRSFTGKLNPAIVNAAKAITDEMERKKAMQAVDRARMADAMMDARTESLRRRLSGGGGGSGIRTGILSSAAAARGGYAGGVLNQRDRLENQRIVKESKAIAKEVVEAFKPILGIGEGGMAAINNTLKFITGSG